MASAAAPVRSLDVYAEAACPEDVAAVLAPYPWSLEAACEVVRCESGYDPYAYNEAGPYRGWWQMSEGKFTDPAMAYDPWLATAKAYDLWLSSGGTFSGHWPGCGRGL